MPDPAYIPDDAVVYVPGHGELTAGELRGGLDGTDEDTTVRMWVWIVTRDPGGKPWRSGHIDAGGSRYPLSVFMSDRIVRLSTSSGTNSGNAANAA